MLFGSYLSPKRYPDKLLVQFAPPNTLAMDVFERSGNFYLGWKPAFELQEMSASTY